MAEEIKKSRKIHLTEKQVGVVENVAKAANFQTGYEVNPNAPMTDAASLRVESLERDIKDLTYGFRDLTIFPDITRTHVESPVHQYDIKDMNGIIGHSRFVPEIGIASLNTPRLQRKTVEMRFISDTKQLSIAAQLANSIADPLQVLESDAAIVIAKTIEWAIFYGDSSLSGQTGATGLEFDGLAKLLAADTDHPENIIDLRGASLTPEYINKASVIIAKGFGTPTDAYMPVGVQADFVNQFLKDQRILVADRENNVQLGLTTAVFNSVRGSIKLHGSTIMDNDNILDTSRPINPSAPFAPASVVATPSTNGGGQFDVTNDASFDYKVVVVGSSYDSAPTQSNTATVVNATDAVTLTITLNSLQNTQPDYVAIYRKGAASGQYFLIARVAANTANNGVITFVDTNAVIPETADVFLGELSKGVITLFEFLPMLKLNLAVTTSSNQFAVLWYGALGLYAPRRWVRIKNVNYVQAFKDPTIYA